MYIETRRTWKKIKSSGENHGAIEWAWMRVRAKGCLLLMQILLIAMCIDRVYRFVFTSWHPSDPFRFYVFGFARIVMSFLIVATAHANTVSYRRLRNESSS